MYSKCLKSELVWNTNFCVFGFQTRVWNLNQNFGFRTHLQYEKMAKTEQLLSLWNPYSLGFQTLTVFKLMVVTKVGNASKNNFYCFFISSLPISVLTLFVPNFFLLVGFFYDMLCKLYFCLWFCLCLLFHVYSSSCLSDISHTKAKVV